MRRLGVNNDDDEDEDGRGEKYEAVKGQSI